MIFRKHLIEAKRHGHKDDYIPSWKCTAPSHTASRCCSPPCKNFPIERLIKPRALFTSPDKLSEVFHTDAQEGRLLFVDSVITMFILPSVVPMLLSVVHPKYGTTFNRRSPDAVKVSQHQILSNTTGQNIGQNVFFLHFPGIVITLTGCIYKI